MGLSISNERVGGYSCSKCQGFNPKPERPERSCDEKEMERLEKEEDEKSDNLSYVKNCPYNINIK